MKLFNISRLTLVLVAILMATTSHAQIDFKIKDVQVIESELGTEIIVPVFAKFNTSVDIWEIDLTFPEGLTPVDVYKSWDMTLGYYNSQGQYAALEADLLTSEDHTHIIGSTFASMGYRRVQNDDGEMVYEPYGTVKWEGYSNSDYNQLLLLKYFVDAGYTGGEIQISGKASRGYDTRYSTSNFTPDAAVDPYQADMNQDGVINITDAVIMINCLAGLDSDYYGGDINQDGLIDLLDYEEMMDYLLFDEWYTGHKSYTCESSASVEVYYPPVNEPAEAIFYINDLDLTSDDLGTEITIPVGAHFGNYISSWDVQFIFPEGLTPVNATNGSGMTRNYYDSRGREVTEDAYLCHNEEYNHFISVSTLEGYQPPTIEGDPYESYGTVKWAAGDYDEMFLITCHVSEDFAGGNIEIITNASSGYDPRNELMTFEPISNETHGPEGYAILPGDINSDGTITIADVTAFIAYLLNPSSFEYIGYGDANHDLVLNIVDIDALCDFLINGQWYAGYALSHDETEATITVPEPNPIGDVNGDGFVTISDITVLVDMLLALDYEYNESIDVNGDGVISIADVTELIDMLLSQNY